MECKLYTRGEPGIFLHKHDVIEIGLKEKGNVPTMCLMFDVYDIQRLITRYM